MNAVPQLSFRLVYLLTLGLLAGLVGCTAAGYPGSPNTGNPPAGNPPIGGGPDSSNPGGDSLTPGAPYPMPMPQPNMPPGILGFFPPDGFQVCPTPRVVLNLQLTDAMRKGGAFDPSKVTLTLDGQNILSKINMVAPMIYPQSHVTLAYVQSTPLALGGHQVKFTYPSTSGPVTLTWNFTVANIACQ